MMDHLRHHLSAAAALAATGMLAFSGLALAQEESPAAEGVDTPGLETTDGAQAHPLHIHSGTCEQLGDIVFPLGGISTDLMVHDEAASGDVVGGVDDQNVALNVTLVAATLEDLTGEAHAINIHQSEEDMGTRIACGDIGGTIVDGDTLVIRLDELSASGYVGMAMFQEHEDGNTTVYSMLTPKEEPVDSPPMEEPTADETEQPAEAGSPAEEAPASEDQATGDDDVTVTVEVDVDEDAEPDVEVEVEEPEESPAA